MEKEKNTTMKPLNQNKMRELTEKEYKELKEKAWHFDKIKSELAEFYSKDNEEECDLSDIGEWISSYFNWI